MTLAVRFKQIVDKFGRHTALAYLVDEQYKKISYRELDRRRLYQANNWKSFGWQKGEKVALMLDNSPEWVISDLAAATLGLIVVPIHTTFNGEYIKRVMEHSGAKYLIINREYFDKHKNTILSFDLKKIIIVGGSLDLKDEKIIGWPRLDLQKKLEDILINVDEDDVHTIIYTSGTTGDPKGVMLTHKNLIVNAESAKRSVNITYKDRFFSFLPLSHAFERTAGYYCPIFTGSSIYFARSSKSIVDDIKKARPTMINSVPRIFERIYGKVFDNVESGSNFKKKLFFKSLKLSVLKRKNELDFLSKLSLFILDLLVLKKVRAILGGRLRLAISGGASLDIKILRFFENLGIDIIEGYGMTETSPVIAVNKVNNSRPGTVGQALDCNEIVVAQNKEILIKGENVMLGYYANDGATSEIIDKDKWLHTGDFGFLDKEGFLTIIGRAKDVIVLSTGKNIFPETIENTLNESRFIVQSMVYGDNQKHISALIVPNFEQLKKWCEENKIEFDLNDQKVQGFYRDKITSRLAHFAQVEQIGDFKLLEEEFSQENGMLTPTLKLKRYKIKKIYL
ncbi:long-chain fatty acid--CoA ligase [Patescibacteria group bacterium]|nr:long-chain fatty acid--CoA ligase [Patescibacteria group bacterium]